VSTFDKAKDTKVRSIIANVGENGKFFSVTFLNSKGDEREMNCRLGVKKHLVGGTKTYPAEAIGVYDCQVKGYRCFYPHKVLRVNGQSV